MDIIINNQNYKMEDNASVSSIFTLFGMSDKGKAVAVNNRVIPRAQWDSHILRHEDKITVITAAYGG
jgi:sulfur carrier protein